MSKRSSYTKARIREGRESAQFRAGEIVYVRMGREALQRAIRDAIDDPRGDRIWIMDDPETERGAYGFVSDLEIV